MFLAEILWFVFGMLAATAAKFVADNVYVDYADRKLAVSGQKPMAVECQSMFQELVQELQDRVQKLEDGLAKAKPMAEESSVKDRQIEWLARIASLSGCPAGERERRSGNGIQCGIDSCEEDCIRCWIDFSKNAVKLDEAKNV